MTTVIDMVCESCNPMLHHPRPCAPDCDHHCHKVWPPHPFIPHIDGRCWYCSKSAAEHAPYLDR